MKFFSIPIYYKDKTFFESVENLIKSFVDYNGTLLKEFYFLFILSTDPEARPSFDAKEYLTQRLKRYGIPFLLIDQRTVDELEAILAAHTFREKFLHVDVKYYHFAFLRNVQLLVPFVLGAESVFMIDDDMLFTEHYVSHALSLLSRHGDDQSVAAFTGPYVEDAGDPIDPGKNIWELKIPYLKRTFAQFDASRDAKAVLGSLGGNILSSCFDLPFDTYLCRGEDFDYPVMLNHSGRAMIYSTGLSLIHDPPDRKKTRRVKWLQMVSDLERFVYLRKKYRKMGVCVDELPLYPKVFITDEDLEDKFIEESTLHFAEFFENSGSLGDLVAEIAKKTDDTSDKYVLLHSEWRRLIAALGSDDALQRSMKDALV
ncbi:MAG: hypothetical protein MI724_13115 [Spirochaetales bacterium]|nr:hypothetical protein [Spirochaetales bacterium]